MNDYRIVLDDFEGPIDLLLYWIKINELDIKSVSISNITDGYLRYLDTLDVIDVNKAGSFIDMAARLLSIKSRRLIMHPTQEDEDFIEQEEESLREEILDKEMEYVHRIMQYFAKKEEKQMQLFPRPEIPLFDNQEETLPLNLEILKKYIAPSLLHDNLRNHYIRKEEKETIAQRIEKLTNVFKKQKELNFSQLIETNYTMLDIILNIVALLELAHRRIIKLQQNEQMGEIIIRRIDENMDKTLF